MKWPMSIFPLVNKASPGRQSTLESLQISVFQRDPFQRDPTSSRFVPMASCPPPGKRLKEHQQKLGNECSSQPGKRALSTYQPPWFREMSPCWVIPPTPPLLLPEVLQDIWRKCVTWMWPSALLYWKTSLYDPSKRRRKYIKLPHQFHT